MENHRGFPVDTGDTSRSDPVSLRRRIELRNELISTEVAVSGFDANSYLTEDCTKLHMEPIPVEAIHECTKDTTRAMTQILDSVEWKFFSYYHLQKVLCLKCQMKLAENLYRDVLNINVPVTGSLTGNVLKEFSSVYGPVDKMHLKIHSLVKRYEVQKAKSATEFIRLCTFYQKMIKRFGALFVKDKLKLIKDNAQKEFQQFLTLIEENTLLYDMNPISSKTHMDWFLLPRTHPTFMKYVLRHSELDQLVEYKIPSETTFIVEGIWPSLVDCCVTNPTRLWEDPNNTKDSISSSFIQSPSHSSEEESNHVDEHWRSFYKDIHTELAQYPLGISLSNFIDVLTKGKWKAVRTLLDPMTPEELVYRLPEVFATETVNGKLIVFPSFMRDIASSSLYSVFYRIWKRIIFLTKFHGGIIRPMDVSIMFGKLFNFPVNVYNWGFKTMKEFVQFCKYVWDESEHETIEIIELTACIGSMLKYSICQNDAERDSQFNP